ncbi:hypothetical protein BLX24_11060 [Arsenicibacter rosenii]|uniref:Tail specific protease domain-containing protein n=1 Tax=Arsenicibacter rosenii TaxID=1750698 RepID=A0A1S2VLD5_9BACT|nr:hypothetical protein BLX24_11060 [Arsenicibacter rosenii]
MLQTASGQTARQANLSDAEKIMGLSTFWAEASQNFAYFDKANINWDSTYKAYIPKVLATKNTWEYYRVLERFCALLKDGHTNINAPWSLYGYSTYVPFRFTYIDQKPYVTRVLKGLSDSVPVGSELLTVNGIPVQTYLRDEVLPYISSSAPHERMNTAMFRIWGATADTITVYPLTFRTPAGKEISFQSRLFSQRERDGSTWLLGNGRDVPKTKLSRLTILPNGVAHVELNSFGEEKIIGEFKAMLPQLRAAKAIILDVRENGGGSTSIGAEIMKYFTAQKTFTGSAWRTRETRSSYKAWGKFLLEEPFDSIKYKNDSWYRRSYQTVTGTSWYIADPNEFTNDLTEPRLTMPVVILAGNNTASAAEDFLIIARQLKDRKIPVIGQPSFGSTGQPLMFPMPGGGSARICTKRDTYADGTDFVGIGVKPDIEVNPTLTDLMAGRDAALDKAVQWVTKK